MPRIKFANKFARHRRKKILKDRAKIEYKLYEIIRRINSSELGCYIVEHLEAKFYDPVARVIRTKIHQEYELPTVMGTAKDGRAIWIYYFKGSTSKIPRVSIRPIMQEMERRGAIVGVALDFWDVWAIISGLQRKPRTWLFLEKDELRRRFNVENQEICAKNQSSSRGNPSS